MINRRTVIAGAAATAAIGAASSGSASEFDIGKSVKPTFVLVHGTWHGGWVWRDVQTRLEAAGHRVFTPTCTGCGERVHLASPDVGLETHIQDIVNVLRFNELSDVILVGHSFSGVTITGVADREKERIRRIIFFDAVVPRPGRMSGLALNADGSIPDWWKKRTEKFENGQMSLWDEYPIEMLVPEGAVDERARLKKLITTHPARQWTDILEVANGGWDGLDPAFIHCIGQKYRMTSDKMVGPAKGPGWTYVPLDAPRNAMMTHPDLTAEILLSLA